jgi:hypothetical protein
MHNSMVYGALSIELRKLSDDEIIKRLARCDKPSENPMFTDDATHIRFFLERAKEGVMGNPKYSKMDPLTILGFQLNALDGTAKEDGDTGASFPRSDAEDLSRGARFIPGEVTLARRDGKKVPFMNACGPNCWYWQLPDSSRIYHFDPMVHAQLAGAPCPQCGNPNTSGGTVTI